MADGGGWSRRRWRRIARVAVRLLLVALVIYLATIVWMLLHHIAPSDPG